MYIYCWATVALGIELQWRWYGRRCVSHWVWRFVAGVLWCDLRLVINWTFMFNWLQLYVAVCLQSKLNYNTTARKSLHFFSKMSVKLAVMPNATYRSLIYSKRTTINCCMIKAIAICYSMCISFVIFDLPVLPACFTHGYIMVFVILLN